MAVIIKSVMQQWRPAMRYYIHAVERETGNILEDRLYNLDLFEIEAQRLEEMGFVDIRLEERWSSLDEMYESLGTDDE